MDTVREVLLGRSRLFFFFFLPLGRPCDLVHVEGRGVGAEDRRSLAGRVQLPEDSLLKAHVLEYCFHDLRAFTAARQGFNVSYKYRGSALAYTYSEMLRVRYQH